MTRIPNGYLLGRVVEQQGPGPWWTYVATVSTLDAAMAEARRLAAKAGVRAWLHQQHDQYEPIDLTT